MVAALLRRSLSRFLDFLQDLSHRNIDDFFHDLRHGSVRSLLHGAQRNVDDLLVDALLRNALLHLRFPLRSAAQGNLETAARLVHGSAPGA